MKITIEAETPEELNVLKEPWVRHGAERIGLAGHCAMEDANGHQHFGFVHGLWIAVKSDLARTTIEMDALTFQQEVIRATIQAHQMIASEGRKDAVIQRAIRNGPADLRIARP